MKEINYQHTLIAQCQEGSRKAQFQLYRQYSKAMYNTCYRMLGSVEDAEDILQKSFLDIFKKIKQYRSEATPGAWIKRIVINNCLDHLRKRKFNFDELTDQHGETILEEVEQHQETVFNVQRIKSAIHALPDGYRVISTMYLLEGFDHREIATVLGISESTSKSQYSRAKKKIQSMVMDHK